MTIKIKIDGKNFYCEASDEWATTLMNTLGAREIVREKASEGVVVKSLSSVDPYTIGILLGGIGVWIVYQVTQQQKESFRKNFANGLN